MNPPKTTRLFPFRQRETNILKKCVNMFVHVTALEKAQKHTDH
jgi:hypothetical protein